MARYKERRTGTLTTPATPFTVTGSIPVGRFATVHRVIIPDDWNATLNVSITDAAGKTVYANAAANCTTGNGIDVYVTADGVAGEDGAAAALTSGGLFEGPLSVSVTGTAENQAGDVLVLANMGSRNGGFKQRHTGTFTGATQDVTLGSQYAAVKKIKLEAVSDTSIAVAIADAYGKNVYTKAASNFTTAVEEQLGHEGVDQAGNAVADVLDVVVKSPVTVTLTGHDASGFRVDFWVET